MKEGDEPYVIKNDIMDVNKKSKTESGNKKYNEGDGDKGRSLGIGEDGIIASTGTSTKYATVSVGKTKVPKKKSQMVHKPIAKRSSSTAKKHVLRKGSKECLGVHMPGTRVYARWWDESDPVAHGTWYPRIVFSVKLAPVQDGSRFHRSSKTPPRLLYHIKFDDGAESLEIKDFHVTSSKR